MKHEEKTLVMVSLENRDCDYKIVGGTVEANAYKLYEKYGRGYPTNYEANGDQIFTFEAIGEIPENEEEREALESESDDGRKARVWNGWKNGREEYIYFRANFDDGESPENFAEKLIDVVRNGKQVYAKKWDESRFINHELETVSIDVTINGKDYCFYAPVEFDKDGYAWLGNGPGVVVDGNGTTYDLNKSSVPGVPDGLWSDIADDIELN